MQLLIHVKRISIVMEINNKIHKRISDELHDPNPLNYPIENEILSITPAPFPFKTSDKIFQDCDEELLGKYEASI